MKKFLMVFILFILFSFNEVKAEEKYADVRWIYKVYYNYKYNNISYWGQMAYIVMDGNISYCIDITKNISNDSYNELSEFDVDNDIMLYGYFGYGYLDSNKLNDYLATQKLIWRKLGVEVEYTTDSNGKGDVINVDENINKINNYIEEYKKGFFIESDFEFEVDNKDKIYIDKLFGEYIISSRGGNVFFPKNNEIIVYPYEIGNYTLTLKQSYINRHKNALYLSDNSQTIIQIGNILNKEYSYNYYVKGASLEINLKNSVTKSSEGLGSEKLDKNVFNLYDNYYSLIGTYETDEEGMLKINNLYSGEYILEHAFISEGYTKDKTIYNISISPDNLEQKVEIELQPKSIKFNITKNYGNPKVGTLFSDTDVNFDFYNSKGELVSKISTDENGKANIDLFYDEYIVKQSSTNNVEEKSEDYIIQKGDFSGDNYYNIYTPVYDSKLKIHLYEIGSTIPIPGAKIIISGKEYITNNEGIIITDYLKEGTNCMYQNNLETYIINNDICVDINENSNFYIEDGEVIVDFIMYNEKKIIEEVTEELVEDNIDNDFNDNSVQQEEIIDILPNLFTRFFNLRNGLYRC